MLEGVPRGYEISKVEGILLGYLLRAGIPSSYFTLPNNSLKFCLTSVAFMYVSHTSPFPLTVASILLNM